MKYAPYKFSKCKLEACIVTVLMALALTVPAQNYAINWFKISSGGGTSSNVNYAVTGTIGQPDAGGAMTGGPYSLTGGFWAIYAVQNSGVPLLSIQRLNGISAKIYWPAPTTDCTLQSTARLTTPNWQPVGTQPGYDGTNNCYYIIVSPPAGNIFFRLAR